MPQQLPRAEPAQLRLSQGLFSSFASELTKLAGRSISSRLMRAAMRRMGAPQLALNRQGDALKARYRAMMQRGAEEVEVPLKERLVAFKRWRKTGELPGVDVQRGDRKSTFKGWRWKEDEVDPFVYKPGTVTREAGDLVSFSGGGSGKSEGGIGLVSAVRRPMTPIDVPKYFPGQSTVALRGIYTAEAKAAAGYSRKGLNPSVARIVAPRKSYLHIAGGGGGERVIPSYLAHTIKEVDIQPTPRGTDVAALFEKKYGGR